MRTLSSFSGEWPVVRDKMLSRFCFWASTCGGAAGGEATRISNERGVSSMLEAGQGMEQVLLVGQRPHTQRLPVWSGDQQDNVARGGLHALAKLRSLAARMSAGRWST